MARSTSSAGRAEQRSGSRGTLAANDGSNTLVLAGRVVRLPWELEAAMTRTAQLDDVARAQRRLPLRLAEVAIYLKAYDAALAHLEAMRAIDPHRCPRITCSAPACSRRVGTKLRPSRRPRR